MLLGLARRAAVLGRAPGARFLAAAPLAQPVGVEGPAVAAEPLRRSQEALAASAANAAAGVNAAAAAAAAASPSSSLLNRYRSLVAARQLRHDAAQEQCVQRLDRLASELRVYSKQVEAYQREHAAWQRRRAELRGPLMAREVARLESEEAAAAEAAASRVGAMRSWLSAALGEPPELPPRRSPRQRQALARPAVEAALDEQVGPAPAAPAAPKGVYLHGSVGSGKSLCMDLLSAAVHAEGIVPLHRRLHFNSGMLELHSRMHTIESHRMESERRQMAAYSAAVQEQQQRQQQREAAPDASGGGGDEEGSSSDGGGDGGWQQILRLDPIAQKLKRSKLARLAFRRMMRDIQRRTASEHDQALAAANASIVRHAARALIRSCDTLALMGLTPHSSTSGGSGGGEAGEGGGDGAEHEGAAGAARVAALLCFDELQVADPFSAVALKALVEALTEEGCVVVTTSNRAPADLDRHGLHEALFDHFLASLTAACDVLSLDSHTDYRRLARAPAPLQPLPAGPEEGALGAAGAAPAAPHPAASYFYPLGPAAAAALDAQWRAVTGGRGGGSSSSDAGAGASPSAAAAQQLEVLFGRRLAVRRASAGAAWFSFEELCARPLGSADYLSIGQAFHTVFLEGVPSMDMQSRDKARRFICLVDELYNHRTRLVCSSDAAPDALFAGTDHSEPIVDLESLQFESAVEGSSLRRDVNAYGGVAPVAATPSEAAAAARRLGGAEERFAFARAVSRLHEMQSELYLASRPRQA